MITKWNFWSELGKLQQEKEDSLKVIQELVDALHWASLFVSNCNPESGDPRDCSLAIEKALTNAKRILRKK